MIKGKTKIQLFDGKTGGEVYRAEDENMVTNAIEKLLNPPVEWLFAGTDFRDLYKNVTPIYKKALGGIMLWKDPLPESAEQIIPPAEAVEVAHAGGAYTGSDTMRGSYNANESGKIENGFRHVWDFGTDRGNCTFSAVTLTSLAGGSAGWSAHRDPAPIYDTPQRFSETSILTQHPTGLQPVAWSDYNARFLGCFRKNIYTFIKYESNGLTVTDIETQNPAKISLMSDLTSALSQNKYTVTRLTGICGSVMSAFVTEDGRVMFLKNSGGTATVTFIDPVTKEILETKSFNRDYLDAYSTAYYKGNYYLARYADGKIYVMCVDEDGNETNTGITNPSGTASILGGRLLIPSGSSLMASSDGINFIALQSNANSGSGGFGYHYENRLPFVPLCYNGSMMILKNYLATINNLSAPVVKTDQQTMKITYEIYNI